MSEKIDYESITESHLAKKYNDLLYDCLMRCNVTGYLQESEPHFSNLRPYAAAIHTLYRNSFMLFYSVKIGTVDKKVNLANILFKKMKDIKDTLRLMKRNPKNITPEFFEKVEEQCHTVHMLIYDGLQARNMLVRMGQNEPRGEQSVFYWGEKESFKKGDIKSYIKTKPKQNVANFFMKG